MPNNAGKAGHRDNENATENEPQGVSLADLADYCGATVQGDASLKVQAVASIEHATARDISYVRGGKYRKFLKTTEAAALILTQALADEYHGTCLIHSNPYLAYAKVVERLYPTEPFPATIHPSAIIAENVSIGAGSHIGPLVVIEANAVIGEQVVIEAQCFIGRNSHIAACTHLHAKVTLAPDTRLGEACIIHSGAVLGADGFGFVPEQQGSWYKIPQVGNVVLGDAVEIGANTSIDRAALGSTYIGEGVKLDNLIQVGHNTQIGDFTAVAACTAIAGSAKIGKRCRIAGMCAIGGHIEIADDTTITATSMVTHSIRKSGVYSAGTTIQDNGVWRKNAVRFHQLDKMARRLADVERQLAELINKEN